MPKITPAGAVVAALFVVALTGCAEASAEPPNAPQGTAQASPSNTPEPLKAETPAEPEPDAADVGFLTYVRANLLPETQIPNATDEQLIEAGHAACEQLASGVPIEDVRVIDGEDPHTNGYFYDSITIRSGATINYCPELG